MNDGRIAWLSNSLAGIGMLAVLALGAQLLGSSWYMGRLLPGTVIGDRDVGGDTLPQAQAALHSAVADYHVQLTIADQQYTFTPAQLGVTYDIDTTLRQTYDQQHHDMALIKPKTTQYLTYGVDAPQLSGAIGAVAAQVGTQPVDAAVLVKNGQFKTVADRDGFTVDKIALARLIEHNLASVSPATVVTAAHRQSADIVLADLDSTVSAAKDLMATPVTLNYNSQVWTPSAAAIGSWLTFTKTDSTPPTLTPVVDQNKLKAYVAGLASHVDVAPVTQLETVTNGTTTVQETGVNGTAINQAATVAAITAAVVARQPLDYTITDTPVSFKTDVTNFTVLDLPSYIEINLSQQHLWVWQDGAIIYDSPITSGATGAGFGTVTGMFHIFYKTTNTYLNGDAYGPRYQYNDFVKYWMPFYSGYGLHDASWRNGNFGETSGPFGYWRDGSHGCVNLPDATAAWVYNWSVVGTPVWVHT